MSIGNLYYRSLVLQLLLQSALLIAVGVYCLSEEKYSVSRLTGYSNRAWQTNEGLPQNSVTSIVQSDDGYLWFGTLEGLARFDGNQFTVFDQTTSPELQSNRILSLCKDAKGVLWVGTEGGGLYTLSDGTFSQTSVPVHLHTGIINTLYYDANGVLWASQRGAGLTKILPAGFKVFTSDDGLLSNNISALASDHNGNLWVGNDKNGINIVTGTAVTTLPLDKRITNNSVLSILRRADSSMVISTMDGILIFKNGSITPLTAEDGLTTNSMWSLLELKDGSLFMGTSGGGLNILKEPRLFRYTVSEGLSNNYIWSMYEDSEGNIWLGTNGGGINRLRKAMFTTYGVEEGLSDNFAWTICSNPAGGVWVGTYNGLNYFDGNNFSDYNFEKGDLPASFIFSCMIDSNGTMWIGTMNGLASVTNKSISTYTTADGLANNEIHSLIRNKSGTLLIGTASGLTTYKNGLFTSYRGKQGFPADMVMVILESKDSTIWLGTSAGLYKISPRLPLESAIPERVTHHAVRALYEDSLHNIWAGTQGAGLLRIHKDTLSIITKAEGLFENGISQILDDRLGNLWMSSNKGIFKVRLNDLLDVVSRRKDNVTSFSYSTEDGMRSQECNGSSQPAGCRTPDGKLWFPTIRGIVCVDPASIPFNSLPPSVVIEQVIADRTPVGNSPGLEIPPGNGDLEIHYTALSFAVPQRVRFKYMLEGYDHAWQDVGTRRVAYYTNLPHGDYTFKVIACNNDGVWNETGQQLHFYIVPPYWKTWWFTVSMFLIIITLVYGIYRYRLNQIRKIEEIRLRLASDLHDEVATNLSSIAMFGELLQTSRSLDEPMKAQLKERITLLARESMTSMREIIWTIDPKPDKLHTLLLKYRDLIQPICAVKNIELEFEIPSKEAIGTVILSSEIRKEFWLAIKEAVHNTVKHSGCTRIHIITTYSNGIVTLKIIDNGIGFDPNQSYRGKGLMSMKKRAENLSGTFDIASGQGKGTTLTLTANVLK